MAIYAIQTDRDGDNWPENAAMRFKFRRRSSDGHECAQTVFDALKSKGVVFESYEMEGFDPETSIFSPGPIKSSWFKDTEGNILGLVQFVGG